MRADTLIIAAYAAALLGLAAALHRLGRARTYAWNSRALAGHRRAVPEAVAEPLGEAVAGDPHADWPHAEVPRLHTGIAMVACSAAILLGAAELIGHHRGPEFAVLGTVVLLGLVTLTRLGRRLRSSA